MNYFKLIIFLGLVLFINIDIIFSQQILNGGFEDTNEFNIETFWHIGFGFNCFDPPFPVFAIIINDSNSGNNAVKLTSDMCYNENVLLPGMINTADFESNGPGFGYEYHERPEFLNFYYKYNPTSSNEKAFVKIMLFNYNTSTYEVTEVIGEASANINEISEYTLFTMPIEYYTESTPDYIHILFSTSENFSYWENQPLYNSNLDNVNSLGTYLLIDDVYVSGGGIGTDDYLLNSIIRVYPNPMLDSLTIQNDSLNIYSIKIFNILGELMLEEKNNFSNIQVSDIDKGLYFLEIETNRGIMTKKIIKK